MTGSELEELLNDCPRLFHMAESGSWPSIAKYGLQSTSALLQLYEIQGRDRERLESERRPECVLLERKGLPGAVIRDQRPMDDAGLRRALPAEIKPADWYRLLNDRVFFWLSRERLLRLLKARAYKDKEHDVLEIDTPSLVAAYRDKIWLCPINSGNTKPFPHPRDFDSFKRIDDYPYTMWRRKRRAGERVVELAVEYGVPDIRRFVLGAFRMKGDAIIRNLAI